ncbi:MAG: GTPase Era [Acidimicrobiia bacterium]|nr:GTPase Era [Acidimicrobiia bacterium]MDH3463594.1 GTPase Era [Acidimicrobiia bacterium]
MRSGFVAVVGRPNVGKSTLVNTMVGSKVTITSSRPQTTRNTIRGVVTGPEPVDPDYQIVLVDTPGLHKPKTELGNRLNGMVYGTLREADVVLFLIDATMPIGPGDRLIADRLRDAKSTVILVLNKIDAAGKGSMLDQLARAAEWDFAAYVPVSARDGEGLGPLVEELVTRLPEGPRYYPEGMTTDQPESLVISEIVREKFLERLREELPHSLVVRVEDLEEHPTGMLDIAADVIVERDSQKGIVIGKGGSLLQLAGTEARHELETLFGTKVNLSLHVVVEKDWQRRSQVLDRFGFQV